MCLFRTSVNNKIAIYAIFKELIIHSICYNVDDILDLKYNYIASNILNYIMNNH